jgi:hypothetical protein
MIPCPECGRYESKHDCTISTCRFCDLEGCAICVMKHECHGHLPEIFMAQCCGQYRPVDQLAMVEGEKWCKPCQQIEGGRGDGLIRGNPGTNPAVRSFQ